MKSTSVNPTPEPQGQQGAFPMASGSAFWRAMRNDVTVAMMTRHKRSLQEIVGALAAEKERYVERIMELESIAPRKVVMPDGKVMLWQCPAELVPPITPNTEVTNAPRAGK